MGTETRNAGSTASSLLRNGKDVNREVVEPSPLLGNANERGLSPLVAQKWKQHEHGGLGIAKWPPDMKHTHDLVFRAQNRAPSTTTKWVYFCPRYVLSTHARWPPCSKEIDERSRWSEGPEGLPWSWHLLATIDGYVSNVDRLVRVEADKKNCDIPYG